jgi:hypothetical protein
MALRRYWSRLWRSPRFSSRLILSIAPTVGVAIVASLVVVIARLNIGREGHAFSRALNWSLWAGLCLWFLPLAEQITSANGNLSTLSVLHRAELRIDLEGELRRLLPHVVRFMLPGFVTAWGGQQVNAVSWSNVALSMTSLIALPWAAASTEHVAIASERTLHFSYWPLR